MADHYEIHVTVKGVDPALFQSACRDANVKPVLLHLQLNGENSIDDMMTSSRFYGDLLDCFLEAWRIEGSLVESGLDPIRLKIEAWPNHKRADQFPLPTRSYFECHIPVNCHTSDTDILREIAREHGSHLSRNAFKINEDGSQVLMLTYRDRTKPKGEFEDRRDAIVHVLKDRGFSVGKIETEFIVYDDNVSHDDGWINNGR